MADKYVNSTDLGYYHNRIKTLFASQTDLDALDDKVDTIIAEGGEPNVIETVKVNGAALTPDAQKAVDVAVPTKTSDLTNDGSDASASPADPFATQSYVAQNGGKIDSISVNGAAQTIDANKNVDLTVPTATTVQNTAEWTYERVKAAIDRGDTILCNFTPGNMPQFPNALVSTLAFVEFRVLKADKLQVYRLLKNGGWQEPTTAVDYAVQSDIPTAVSSLTNDSGYQTASDVQTAIDNAVTSAYRYKGSVATYADLPSSGQTAGDVWDVQADGMNYAWTGSAWDALGQYVDVSTLWGKSELEAMTTAEIDALFA